MPNSPGRGARTPARPATQYQPTRVSPPGDTLRDLLDERGISQADLAERMGRPQKTISEIVNGKAALTEATALELELVLGVPAGFWIAREGRYREWLAREAQAERLVADAEWAASFPVAAMRRFGMIPEAKVPVERVRVLLEFFGVASREQWEVTHATQAVAFRHPGRVVSDAPALAAWLRAGVVEAERTATAPFDRARFEAVLRGARALTRETPDVFVPALKQRLADVGVVLAFVRELPGARACGATRWTAPDRALIQLSLRYKTDDHLWFTFFHEAAHVLLHGKRRAFLEGAGADCDDPDEVQANEWAGEFLVPRAALHAFAAGKPYAAGAITAFAREMGITPGIVVGQLQHAGLIPRSHCNQHKRRLAWAEPEGAA